MTYPHGGDTYGRDVRLDFSVNLNPLGMPENVKKAAAAAAAASDRYPDPYCRELIEKLSEHEGANAANIVCGNGAAELIYRIVGTVMPRKAMIARPTFSEYAKALREAGSSVTENAPDDIADALDAETDMLILCNPENPTGQLIDRELLAELCGKCREKGIIFMCDECFIDFCDNADERSAKQFMDDNIIILKAFTKTYSMAGLRLGYAIFGSAELAEKVRGRWQHWSVSVPAQAAGIAALDEREYLRKARKVIADERRYLSEELRRNGCEVYPSDSDFILFRCGMPLDEMMLGEGILIRSCANFSGLGDGYFRVAVKTHSENEVLIGAVERCVERWQKT